MRTQKNAHLRLVNISGLEMDYFMVSQPMSFRILMMQIVQNDKQFEVEIIATNHRILRF